MTHIRSGISYYTYQVTDTLARQGDVSVILMRQLLPTRLHPDKGHIGTEIVKLAYRP